MRWKRIWTLALAVVLALAACARSFAAAAPAALTAHEAAPAPEAAPAAAGAAGALREAAAPAPALPCKAALLMSSDTGEVLYEMHADEELPMASITKVMTLLLTFEALADGRVTLQDTVPASLHAASMGGSQIWLEPGEEFTLHELLKAIVVASANDAAVAVAEYVGGSEPAFVEQMNARAAELGMTHTCFKNACGLDEAGHFSSARDIAVMSLALMQHAEVFDYTSIWTDTLRGGQTMLTNTNKLLRSYAGITGLKTGTTGGAGVCISATATREGMGLIAVILGANSSKERFEAAGALLDYGFAHFERVQLPAPGLPAQLPVSGGSEQSVGIVCRMPPCLVLPRGAAGALRCEVQLPQPLCAPLAAGQPVGAVVLYNGDAVVASYPVEVQQGVEAMTGRLGLAMLYEALFAV